MKQKVLITAPYFQLVLDEYRDFFNKNNIEIIVPQVNERMSEEQMLELIEGIDGIICGDDKITKKVIDKADKLKVIVKWGTGIDSIDKEYAEQNGIPVKNTPGAFTEPVADHILSGMLCFARGTIELDRNIRKGLWEKKLKTTLGECTLGVIGVGNIGQAVIKRAQAFGMNILGNDLKDLPFDFMVSKEDLLKQSDFVVLSTDLNSTSYHIISEKEFDLMKDSAYLINSARGPLIKESALISALRENKIAGVALDVFEEEPLVDDHPFKKMENVIMTPHNANSSPKAWKNVHENSVKNLIENLK